LAEPRARLRRALVFSRPLLGCGLVYGDGRVLVGEPDVHRRHAQLVKLIGGGVGHKGGVRRANVGREPLLTEATPDAVLGDGHL
jgi:hypothetical protein